jgi:CRP-like cAMP-binding protein
MPGDFCDLHVTMLARMDHGIAALSPVTVARVSRRDLDALRAARPVISLGFDWMTMVDLGTLRAWIASIGQARALGRVAHLICELHQRSINIGAATATSLPFHLTQLEMADATGQTSVHVNRIVKELRHHDLALVDRRSVTILNLDGLRHVCGFDPGYLHAQQLAHK